MSISDSTVEGKFDQVVGKAKQGIGEAFNNQSLANEGAADQVKGHAKEAVGSVKEAATDAKTHNDADAQASAHNTRESITEGAEHLKDKVVAGVNAFKSK